MTHQLVRGSPRRSLTPPTVVWDCRRDRPPPGSTSHGSGSYAKAGDQPLSRSRPKLQQHSERSETTKTRQQCEKEILMSSPSTPMPTPEGPGSVSGAPNLPQGFADTFA